MQRPRGGGNRDIVKDVKENKYVSSTGDQIGQNVASVGRDLITQGLVYSVKDPDVSFDSNGSP